MPISTTTANHPRRRKKSSNAEVVNVVDMPLIDVGNGAGTANDPIRGKKARKKKKEAAVWWKPKWVTVLSWVTPLAKILLLLLFVGALFQMIRKVGNNLNLGVPGFSVTDTDTDTKGRIAELESYAKVLQLRVEVAEKKVEVAEGRIEKQQGSVGVAGRVDHAAGARVVKHSDPLFKGRDGTTATWFTMANPYGVHTDSAKVLTPGFGQPGDCFPLKGTTGFIQIKLKTDINPEAVTVEHVAASAAAAAKGVAYDRSSAPRDFQVYGWLYGPVKKHCRDTKSSERTLLTEFTYDLHKSNAQTFNVTDSANSLVVNMIRFDYTSNHGNASHTCIYRLRVHGHHPS